MEREGFPGKVAFKCPYIFSKHDFATSTGISLTLFQKPGANYAFVWIWSSPGIYVVAARLVVKTVVTFLSFASESTVNAANPIL